MRGSDVPAGPVAVLGLGMFGFGLIVGGFGAYVSELVARDITPARAGLGSTLFLFGQLVIVLPTDLLSRRWSLRYVAAAGFVLGGVGIALGGFLSFGVHLTGRLLLGLGMGVTFLLAMKYAGLRTNGTTVARLQGILGGLFTLGLALGIAAMPWAVGRFGPLAPAVATSVPVFAAGLLTPLLAPVQEEQAVPISAYLQPFRSVAGTALGFANAASYGLLVVAITWYTDIAAQLPTLPVALVLTAFAIATFVGRTGSGWLTVVTSGRRAVGHSLAFLTAALALVAVALQVSSPLLLALALVLTGLGFGLPFGPLFALAFERVESDAGVLLVGMTALGNAAALAYPWLVGWLLARTGGYVVGFVGMALSVLAVTAFWYRAVDEPTN